MLIPKCKPTEHQWSDWDYPEDEDYRIRICLECGEADVDPLDKEDAEQGAIREYLQSLRHREFSSKMHVDYLPDAAKKSEWLDTNEESEEEDSSD